MTALHSAVHTEVYDDLDFVSWSLMCQKYKLQNVLSRFLLQFLSTVVCMLYDAQYKMCNSGVFKGDDLHIFGQSMGWACQKLTFGFSQTP